MHPRPGTGSVEVPRPAALPNLDATNLEDAVDAFWQHHERFGEPLRSAVAQLARTALATDRDSAVRATRLLFEGVIEPLCDAFTEAGVTTYRKAFAQIIAIAREEVCCEPLHQALTDENILSESDLLARITQPSQPLSSSLEQSRVRKVFVFSRLTLGADVAITSIILQRASQLFPNADIHLVGTAAAEVLAQSIDKVDLLEVPYRRSDQLANRLNAWPVLRRQLLTASAGVASDEVVVIDTDSRLTQLGLLPPLPWARNYQFPSRNYATGKSSPLSELVGQWLDEMFGDGSPLLPRLCLSRQDTAWSRALRAGIDGDEPIVCISFGVGGNERKRAGIRFETDLIEWIVSEGFKVLLARGVGTNEVEQTYRITHRLEVLGIPVLHLPRGRVLPSVNGNAPAQIVTWEADVGAFLASVACCDFYLGYDSAGQHIAAALGVPTLSLFVECAGPRHADRWSPRGPATVKVVRAAPPINPETLIDVTKQEFRLLAGTRRTSVL